MLSYVSGRKERGVANLGSGIEGLLVSTMEGNTSPAPCLGTIFRKGYTTMLVSTPRRHGRPIPAVARTQPVYIAQRYRPLITTIMLTRTEAGATVTVSGNDAMPDIFGRHLPGPSATMAQGRGSVRGRYLAFKFPFFTIRPVKC